MASKLGRGGWGPLGVLVVGLVLAIGLALAADARTRWLLGSSFLLGAQVAMLAVPLGTVLAWLLVRSDLPGRAIAGGVLAAMLFVPLYVHVAAWDAAFGIQGWLTLASLQPGAGPLVSGWRAAVWIHAVAAVPWVVLIVGAALRLARPELDEQALLDAAPLQVACRVTLPTSLPLIVGACLWTVVTVFGEITITDVYQVRTYAEELYTQVALGDDLGAARANPWVGTFLVALLALAVWVVCLPLVPRGDAAATRAPVRFPLGAARWPLAALVGALLCLLAVVPLAGLIYKAGVVVELDGDERLRQWSARKCVQLTLASPWRFREELAWTLAIGQLASLTAVAAAIPLALGAVRGRVGALPGWLLVTLGLSVPGPLLAVAVIRLLNRPEGPLLIWLYDRSLFAPGIVQLFRTLPVAFLIVWHALRLVPAETLETAALEGAGPLVRLWKVVVPQITAALACAWLASLALSMGELGASILTVPPGVNTLAIRIFGLVHYGVEDQLAALSLAVAALFAALAGGVLWLACVAEGGNL